jgi:hypothetical protein
MNLSGYNLPVPDLGQYHAALRKLRAFQERGVLNRCLYWSDGCKSPPVSSHSISRCWLEEIADETNHVVTFRFNAEVAGKRPVTIEAERIGINEATVFRGFCGPHDSELFSCLETREFVASPEQLLALAYRSVCREACAKHRMVDFQLNLGMVEDTPTPHGVRTIAEMYRCIQLMTKKQSLEQMRGSAHPGLSSCIVEFACPPTVLVSGTFYPLVTFTGRSLEFREEWITLTILPTGNGAAAVFSWEDAHAKNGPLLVKSFGRVAAHLQTTALLNLVFEASENFAVAPKWWESLSESEKRGLRKRYARSFTMGNDLPPAATLLPGQHPLIDWRPKSIRFV